VRCGDLPVTEQGVERDFDPRAIERRIHRITLAWFALVAALLLGAGAFSFRRLRGTIEGYVKERAAGVSDSLHSKLQITDSIYRRLAIAAVNVLENESLELGPPRLGAGEVFLGGKPLPKLLFGATDVASTPSIVTDVSRQVGGTSTVFVKSGDQFIRLISSVKDAEGRSAVGTQLDPKGAAFQSLADGRSYVGLAEILGSKYYTAYLPIRSEEGRIVGAWYAGYPIATIQEIERSVRETRILTNGFLVLEDNSGRFQLQTDDVPSSTLDSVLSGLDRKGPEVQSRPGGFEVTQRSFLPWKFNILTVEYRPDIDRLALELTWGVLGLMAVVILAVLALSWLYGQRLSRALIAGEISRRQAESEHLAADLARDEAQQANRTKSAFLANMSHELRTPMNAIIGYSEMLIEEANELEPQEFVPDLNKILAAGKHLLGLINDVLDLSKIEAGKATIYLEKFAVASVVEDVIATVKPLIAKNGNQFELSLAPALGEMRADVTKLRQCLLNLLSNSAKFTEHGTISLRVMAQAPSSAGDQDQSQASGEVISFAVSDTGIGMSPEQQGRLFESFSQADDSTTRKYGGTGLGLSISRQFSRLMGGDITVVSGIGEGSTFTLVVPRWVVDPAASPQESPAHSRAEDSVAEVPPAVAPRATVLVIDDDPSVRELAGRSLLQEGYAVHTAASGEEGLALARQMRPDVITLDVMMPGMDGWTVLQQLKGDPELASIPVVMMSMLDVEELADTMGAAASVSKPVPAPQLNALLAQILASHPSDASRLLVVEDEPINADLLRRMLEKQGWQVDHASNGLDALNVVAKRRPRLILLDLMMPGMDGIAFLEQLRRNPLADSIPVLVVTAKTLSAQDRTLLHGRVSDVIAKGTFTAVSLAEQINAILGPRT
jgi:signal transduction histidine kinase/CheY-like chemotaxis protein